jgi:hypothetical protein
VNAKDKRYAVVVTTINVPRFIPAYLENFRRGGYRHVRFVVIGDLNTPPEAEAYCEQLDAPSEVDFYGPERQREILREFPRLDALLPWRSIQRRNLGYLIAYRDGADVIISMDDDNFLHEEDHLAAHALVGETADVRCVRTDVGWWNVCSLLATEPRRRFYHRGHPFSKRWLPAREEWSVRRGRVAVNAGLWLGDADVDTVTRVEEPFKVTSLVGDDGPVGLHAGTMAPFNSQNTAKIRDLLPFMFLVVAGDQLRGHRARFTNFRYDDIWMSYFARAAIDRMGDIVTYGRPLVVQERNPHDLLIDLDRELVPMFLTETLCETLATVELRSTDYPSLHRELCEALRSRFSAHAKLSEPERAFLLGVVDGMAIWADCCDRL